MMVVENILWGHIGTYIEILVLWSIQHCEDKNSAKYYFPTPEEKRKARIDVTRLQILQIVALVRLECSTLLFSNQRSCYVCTGLLQCVDRVARISILLPGTNSMPFLCGTVVLSCLRCTGSSQFPESTPLI